MSPTESENPKAMSAVLHSSFPVSCENVTHSSALNKNSHVTLENYRLCAPQQLIRELPTKNLSKLKNVSYEMCDSSSCSVLMCILHWCTLSFKLSHSEWNNRQNQWGTHCAIKPQAPPPIQSFFSRSPSIHTSTLLCSAASGLMTRCFWNHIRGPFIKVSLGSV